MFADPRFAGVGHGDGPGALAGVLAGSGGVVEGPEVCGDFRDSQSGFFGDFAVQCRDWIGVGGFDFSGGQFASAAAEIVDGSFQQQDTAAVVDYGTNDLLGDAVGGVLMSDSG